MFLFQIPEAFGQKKERGMLGGGKGMGVAACGSEAGPKRTLTGRRNRDFIHFIVLFAGRSSSVRVVRDQI